MNSGKRITIATLSGVLFGLVCYGFASSGPGELAAPIVWQIVTSRALIGFGIGISRVRMGHWSIHGIVMGLLFSLPLAFSGLMAPENPEFTKTSMFVMTVVMGMVYGFLIELITSVLLKAKVDTPAPAVAV
jgi:hypothetical protein